MEQLQERLVEGIAQEVRERADTFDVGVTATGVHLCMAARGIRTDAPMTSSALYGRFREDPRTRSEFLALAARAA